jgi:hypothetical protein
MTAGNVSYVLQEMPRAEEEYSTRSLSEN